MRNGMFPMEAAPRDGTPVILVNKHGAIDADVWWTGDFWTSLLGELDDDYAGWMPSPNIQYPAGVIPKTQAEKLLEEAAEALRASQEAFEALAKHLPQVDVDVITGFRIVEANHKARAFLAKLEARNA